MLDQLVGGIALGGVYALIAIGYTMVYGVIELINFAHGEVMMLGTFYILAFAAPMSPFIALWLGLFTGAAAFLACEIWFRRRMGAAGGLAAALAVAAVVGHAVKILALMAVPVALAIPAGIICAGVIGAALERVAYRPLRNSPRLAPLISAIGASLFFQNIAQLIFGTYRYSLPFGASLGAMRLAGTDISMSTAIIIGTTILTMASLHLFITRTRIGTAMRATAQDRTAAALMGIDVDFVITLTFVIGSMLAAVGGLLFTIHLKTLWPYMGFMAGIKAFTAAVLGGIGSIPGAMVGGFVLGIVESMGAGVLGEAGYKDGIAFTILIIVLLFKPTGLLGKPSIVKV